MKNKHLSFEERCVIERCLNEGCSVHVIAKKLGRPDSSIVREIKRNRYVSKQPQTPICQENGDCTCQVHFSSEECLRETVSCHTQSCRGCNIMCNQDNCRYFKPYVCKRLRKSPFVCNGCDYVSRCIDHRSCHYKYQAQRAEVVYRDTLKESRQGVSISSEEMQALDNLVSPLLLQGQSISAIYMTHKEELPCSESTLYNYVDRCYLTARNIDMPRKVRFKTRYNHGPRAQSFQAFAVNRTYIDFQKYLESHPDANIWEIDTVIGINGGKSLLTLLYRKSTLMIAVLLDKHTQEAVIEALNGLCDVIGIETFQRLFQVILGDRGIEFGNPYAIECDRYGEIKTRMFYCDPYCSWQKGMLEKNHEFIRAVLPKGESFNDLSQEDVDVMINHINNYPRESLNGASPFDLSEVLLGKDFLKSLRFYRIKRDDVVLKLWLLKKRK